MLSQRGRGVTFDDVLSLLEKVRPGGSGYTARCPAHDDRSPSLSVCEGSDGRILLYCHAGCSFEDICSSLSIDPRDLFNDAYRPVRISRPAQVSKTTRQALPEPEIATLETRHAGYTTMLEALTLDNKHADNLEARGLSDTEIAIQLYASVPDEPRAKMLTQGLASRFDLTGIPGFFYEDEQWQMVRCDPGFFIPIRDHRCLIQGLQIRHDEDGQRYKWFSSGWHCNGVSSGSPMHFAAPWRVELTRQLIITEGGLKAQVAAEFLEDAVLGLAGVGAYPESIGRDLQKLFPTLERVAIAFDNDWRIKPGVKEMLLGLGDKLRLSNLSVYVRKWPEFVDGTRAKGIDDFLKIVSTDERYSKNPFHGYSF